jgi:cyclopropane fatty-acyl-phospholipid synthase-like methyltransferase
MNTFIETKILPYLPDMVIRFFIQIMIIYNLYILKKYNGPNEENAKLKSINENTGKISINNSGYTSSYRDLIYGANKLTYGGVAKKHYNNITALETENIKIIEAKLNLDTLNNGETILDVNCQWGAVVLYLAQKYPDLNFIGYSKHASHINYINNGNTCDNLKVFEYCDAPKDTKYARIISIGDINTYGDYNTYFKTIRDTLTYDGYLYLQTITHRENTIIVNKTNLFSHFFTGDGNYVIPAINLFYKFQDYLTIKNTECIPGYYKSIMVNMWLSNLERNKNAFISGAFGNNIHTYERWRLFYLTIIECLGSNSGREFVTTSYIMTKRT